MKDTLASRLGHLKHVRTLVPPDSLVRNRDFSLLWVGQSVSMIGSGVTTVALPSLAVLTLHAGPIVVGTLVAVQWAPYVVLGPFAGVWADRMPRRRLMVVTDLLRMASLGSIPIANSLGMLSLAHVLAAAVVVGFANVFFNVAYHAYLPSLVPKAHLTDGNAKLGLSQSAANVLGPLIAGVLIGVFGAATALTVDAFSFFVSATATLCIRAKEQHQAGGKAAGTTLQDLREGAAAVIKNRYLVGICGATTTGNFAFSIASSVLLLYLYRDLHLSPGEVGIALAVGGGTLAISTLSAKRLSNWLGIGKVMLFGPVVFGAGYLLLPLASHVALPLLVVFVSQILLSLTRGANNVAILSIVQSATPNRLLGRVNGVTLPFVFGSIAVGGLIGGEIASSIGYTRTLFLAGVVALLQIAWVLGSPIHSIGHELPPAVETDEDDTEIAAPEVVPEEMA